MPATLTLEPGTPVEVCVLWPYDMTEMWLPGFLVVADQGETVIVRGPSGASATALHKRVRRVT